MKKIDTSKPIYFYDDRSKYDWMFKLINILYEDNDTCIAMVECTDPKWNLKEKLVFNPTDGRVITSDYDSWIATNDLEWAIPEAERIRKRGEE